MSWLRKVLGIGAAKPPVFEIPTHEYNALLAGAMNLTHGLEDVLKNAKRGRIESSDVEQLISELKLACGRAIAERQKTLDNSKTTDVTRWDAEGHALYVEPEAKFLMAPEAVVNAAIEAAKGQVTEADVLYKYMIAELEAALQRWQISLRAAIRTANPPS